MTHELDLYRTANLLMHQYGTEDALLVCPKSRAQDVKKVVEALGRRGQTDYL